MILKELKEEMKAEMRDELRKIQNRIAEDMEQRIETPFAVSEVFNSFIINSHQVFLFCRFMIRNSTKKLMNMTT